MSWTEFSEHASSSVRAAPAANYRAKNTGQLPLRYESSWRGINAEVLELHGPGPYLAAHRSDKPLLVVALEEIGGELETRLSPDRSAQTQYSDTNQLALVPPGAPVWEYAKQFSYIRRIVIEFDINLLQATNEACPTFQFKFNAPLTFSNVYLRILVELVANECVNPQSDNRLYRDSLGHVLYHNLLHHADAEQITKRSNGLTSRQLRHVTEYIKQSSSSSVHVQDMARVVGYSQSYFSRAFKSATGISPLRWHRIKRIQHAQQILLETQQPLVDVALSTGFADQSHFTRVFRSVAGESPGAWRRNHKPAIQRTKKL
jgi:AraC family transcriptional regulator